MDHTPRSGLTDEECIAAMAALRATMTPSKPRGNVTRAANSLGMDRSTYRNRISKYHLRDLGKTLPVDVAPGMEVASVSRTANAEGDITSTSIKTRKESGDQFTVPEDYLLERATYQTDGDGNLTQSWLKLRADHQTIDGAMEALKAFADTIQPPTRPMLLKNPEEYSQELLNFFPLPDMHLGLFAWGAETLGQNWDLKTAMRVYKDVMKTVMERSPAATKAVILGGGDLVHSDNMDNKTRKSGNALDVDSRYQKVVLAAIELMIYQVEIALEKHETVEVRILPGNHDEHVAVAVTYAVWAWFRDEERVVIDKDPGDFWFMQWGTTMLAANHGHKTKITAMPSIMANRQRKMWGSSVHCYAHGFHIHHKNQFIFEDGGAICETHQAPVAQDAYHAGGPYISGRSMSSISYHTSRGEKGRAIETLDFDE